MSERASEREFNFEQVLSKLELGAEEASCSFFPPSLLAANQTGAPSWRQNSAWLRPPEEGASLSFDWTCCALTLTSARAAKGWP